MNGNLVMLNNLLLSVLNVKALIGTERENIKNPKKREVIWVR